MYVEETQVHAKVTTIFFSKVYKDVLVKSVLPVKRDQGMLPYLARLREAAAQETSMRPVRS